MRVRRGHATVAGLFATLLGLVLLGVPNFRLEANQLSRFRPRTYPAPQNPVSGDVCLGKHFLAGGAQGVADPVDLATGAFQVYEPLLSVPSRMPMQVGWMFQSLNLSRGPLGIGTSLTTDYFIQPWFASRAQLELLAPGHRHFLFDTKTAAGLIDTKDPDLAGAVFQPTRSPVSGTPSTGGNPLPQTILSGTLTWRTGEQFVFDSSGSLVRIYDRNQKNYININRAPYPFGWAPTSMTQYPGGRTIIFTYYPNFPSRPTPYDGCLKSVYVAYGTKNGWNFNYDPNTGQLTSVQDPNGYYTRYHWSFRSSSDGEMGGYQFPMIDAVDDPSAAAYTHRISLGYDSALRCILQQFADGGQTLIDYSTLNQTTVTDANRNVTKFLYHWNAGGGKNVGYSLNQTVDPSGRTMTVAHNGPNNLPSAITDYRNRTTLLNWDTRGNLLSMTGPTAASGGSLTVSATYDPRWNRVADLWIHDPDPTSTVDPNPQRGRHVKYEIESSTGNVKSVTDPLGNKTQFQYDSTATHWGDLRQVTATPSTGQTLTTGYVYNDAGDLTQVTDPAGVATTITPDSVGRVSSVSRTVRGKNRVVSLTYNSMDQVTSVTRMLNGVAKTVQYVYDPSSRLSYILDPLYHRQWQWTYDSMDRVQTVKDVRNLTASFTWDGNGNLKSETDRRGQKVEFVYGLADELQTATYHNTLGAVESTITYGHDATSHLLNSVSDASGTYSYGRDALDRVTSESTPNGTVSWLLDEFGRRTQLNVPGQAAVTYGYDDADNLKSVTQNGLSTYYSYDGLNRRILQQLPNNVNTSYTFDNSGHLQTLNHLGLESHTYVRDAAGNIGTDTLSRGGTNTVTTYTYDDFDRLFTSSSPGLNTSYTYSDTGNLLSKQINGVTTTFGYDAANRISSVNNSTTNLAHDDNGNLTQLGNDVYAWDARGRLTSIQRNGSPLATFGYDPAGRRISKTINGTTTGFLYDGTDVVTETTGAASFQSIYGPFGEAPLARNGIFYTTDNVGSVSTLTGPTGTVQQPPYVYTPYGESNAAATDLNPFQYVGRENDGTGLNYHRARFYAPALGRFINPDPSGLSGGANPYVYAGDNPASHADANGAFSFGDDDGSPAYDRAYTSMLYARDPEGVKTARKMWESFPNCFPPTAIAYNGLTAIFGKDAFGCNLTSGERVGRGFGAALAGACEGIGALSEVAGEGGIGGIGGSSGGGGKIPRRDIALGVREHIGEFVKMLEADGDYVGNMDWWGFEQDGNLKNNIADKMAECIRSGGTIHFNMKGLPIDENLYNPEYSTTTWELSKVLREYPDRVIFYFWE